MSKCALPNCNKQARRKFCSNKHKDKYHNLRNPRGYYAHLGDGSGETDEDIEEYALEALGEDFLLDCGDRE